MARFGHSGLTRAPIRGTVSLVTGSRTQLAALALVVAGLVSACGGSTNNGPGGIGESGASLVSSGAVVYASVDSDLSSGRWQQVDELLKKFPIRDKLLDELKQALAKHQLDYDDDIKPALGPELDVASVPGTSAQDTPYAVFTKPDSIDKAKALVSKLNEGSSPEVTRVVDGWLFIGDTQTMIDRVLKGSGSALADDSRFKEAFGQLPEDSLAKLYANGPALSKLVSSFSAVAQAAALQGSDSNKLDWVAVAAFAEDDGIKIEGDAKSTTGGSLVGPAYSSKLILGVPADSFAFLTYHGRGGSDPLKSLRQNPSFGEALRQIEQELGMPLDTVLALFQHETAFYVRRGPGLPEFSLVLEAPDTEQALTTINRLAARVATLSSARLGTEREDGLDVKTLDFGPVTVRWAGFDGRVLLTTSPTGISDYRSSGDKLADSSAYRDALDGAGAPEETNGLVYLNVGDLAHLIENYAGLAGGNLPAELEPNLKPLRSFVAYGGSDGDLTTFAAKLEIK
jgi:hypothetical protein